MTPPRLKFKTLSFINMILGSHEYTNQKKRKEIIFQANVNLLFNSTDQKLHTYFVYFRYKLLSQIYLICNRQQLNNAH